MEFPDLVYRCPGEHTCKGGSYKSKQVKNEAEHAAALADGWFDTLPGALEGKPAKLAEPVVKTADETAPPTREELKQKAADLGIKHAHNVTDAKLAELIAAKLAEPVGE